MNPSAPTDRPRWRLILNGKAAGDEDVRGAVAAMRAAGIALDVRVTWERGDGGRYVAEAIADNVDTVVAGGGDGTLSEVAGALARSDRDADALPALALLPLGTANDFAVAAGIPDDAGAALQLVRSVPAVPIDLLRIEAGGEEHWCANLASGGFGTQVTQQTDDGLKRMLGGLAYLITGIARLGRIEPIQARVYGPEFDWTGGFIALGIGNGRQAGGGQVLCPAALLDDDVLELTIVPSLEGEVGATVASLLAEGRQAALDRIAMRARLPWLEIEAQAPFVLNLDGEPVESTRFHIDCVAHRLRMHLPAGCALLRVPGRPSPTAGRDSPGPPPAASPA